MERRTLVYSCPFCHDLVWFNTEEELTWHLYKNHNKEALFDYATQCKTKAIKKNGLWKHF